MAPPIWWLLTPKAQQAVREHYDLPHAWCPEEPRGHRIPLAEALLSAEQLAREMGWPDVEKRRLRDALERRAMEAEAI
jgi:hypothetical protein